MSRKPASKEIDTTELDEVSKLITLDTSVIQKAAWLATRDDLVKQLATLRMVSSDDDLTVAGGLQTKASKHLKELETIRVEAKKPALDFGKEIDGQAKEMRKDLEEGVARVKALNSAYATRRAHEAEQERLRIQEEEAQKALENETKEPELFGGLVIDQPEEAPRSLPEIKAKTSDNITVEVWEHEIIDPKLVPEQFKIVDEKKIRAHVQYCKRMEMSPELPGVRIIKRMDVRCKG